VRRPAAEAGLPKAAWFSALVLLVVSVLAMLVTVPNDVD
jgi:hypothetical protein